MGPHDLFEALVAYVVVLVRKQAGFTIDPATGRELVPADCARYAVADGSHFVSLPPLELERPSCVRDCLRRLLFRIRLAELLGERAYLGGWLNSATGNYVLSITWLAPDTCGAIRLATVHSQNFAFDLTVGRDVDLESLAEQPLPSLGR